jgi:hypothetical protein
MLPGFRFLFAAIVLSMSILIFGLGAAALLRAAHDQFASIPSRRGLPEPVFAQQPTFARQSEAPAATLAMLRVEAAVAEKTPDNPSAAVISVPVEPAPEAVPVPPIDTQQLAALRVDEPAPPEPAKPEMAVKPEPAAPAEAAPVQAATPAVADEINVAAVEQAASSVATEAAPATSAALEPVIVPPAPESIGISTRIAALGSPAVTVEGPATAKPKSAQADKSAARKRLQAKRAKERRRLAAQRARLAREAAAALQQQQQADPFAPQPTITTATTVRRR